MPLVHLTLAESASEAAHTWSSVISPSSPRRSAGPQRMVQGRLCMCTELQGRASSGQWTRQQLQLRVKEKAVTQQGVTQMYKL